MLGYLTILSVSAIVFVMLLLLLLFKNKNFKEIIRYCEMGFIAAFADFIIEYLGTLNGHWTYNESVYFIFELVPIELVFLFFSAGVIARLIFLNIKKIKIPIKANGILYILILVALLMYIRELYQEPVSDMLPFAILVGLWGITNISERNRESALLLAVLAVVLDLVSEVIIIGSGSYNYVYGFSFHIPLIYGLETLGLLAVMEKLNKLDKFLDNPFVRKILKLFGIYRKRYEKKMKKMRILLL